MHIARLSFLVYSLSLLSAVTGQSNGLGDIGGALTSGGAATTSASESSQAPPDSTTSATSSTQTTAAETTSSPPPATTTGDSSTSSTASTSSENAATTTSAGAATTTGASTTSLTTSSTVHTYTTFHTISGTPVPTTYTSTSATVSEATGEPGLSTTGKGSDSGLKSSTKKIIIGVCVGVGGAIVLGALAVVVWRVQAKKRHAHDNDEATDLMSGTAVGSGTREKAPSPSSGNQFRSTLDQYHNVNAASNF